LKEVKFTKLQSLLLT